MTAKSAVLLADLRERVREIVLASPGQRIRDKVREAAETLRLPESRVADWHYGEVRRVEAWEANQIRARAIGATRDRIQRLERELSYLRSELGDSLPCGLDCLVPAAARPARSRHPRKGTKPAFA